ncbi:Uncharacterised protein [Rodentibacter pneumotropicus]|uniref:Uncharacterized protein n=1 Tax=Rodentibacter pneumotropicus TaxID=758 RepID=A0A3S4U951_9PAST|nr:hypothetical protein [Rodentibacter heylii]OOF80253.1 hypothetical protein BKG97_07610 [Rodentibacter heylii]QIA76637.1 hypothetical protein FEE42_04335 [Rodentibacter heylii]VEH66719.1 Uncharacterised protein [Rodentibacter pneumotropicus]
MQIDFNLMEGICKMLEVIDRSHKARTFAYLFLIFVFIIALLWVSPNFLKALSDFILTLRQG